MSGDFGRAGRIAGLLTMGMLAAGTATAQTEAHDEALATIPVATPAPDAPPPLAESAAPVALDDIVVTARKRAERLQNVPVSVSAFSGAQLDARGATTLRDLAQIVPGLTVTDLGGYNLIYLRGVGTDIFIPSSEPSVATYLDGIYFPSGHSLAQSFGALERVEVLKGPQGTLFGRNSTGGALSIWSQAPDPTPALSIQSSYAEYDDWRSRLHANIPLGDTLAASLSAFYNQRDSYYTLDNGTGDALPSEVNQGARVRLGFNFSEQASLILTGLVARQRGTSTTVSANVDPTGLFGAALQPETREYVATANSEPKLTTDSRAFYGQFNWNHPGIDTKLLGSYYHVRAYDYVYDFDGTRQPIATYGADNEFQRFVTGELQFSSNDDSWGASWLKWVGGIYYLQSQGGYDPGYLRLIDLVQLPVGDVLQEFPVLGTFLGNLAGTVLGGAPVPQSLTFFFTGLLDTESWSGYLQTTASLTDWLDLTLGGRWQYETRHLVQSDVSVRNLSGNLVRAYGFQPAESSAHNVSPKVSLDLRPFDDFLIYASFQRGFKSGTYNIINIFAQPEYVEPEEVSSWEVGIKSEWLARTLRVNVAAFRNDIENQQTGFMSFTSGGAVNLENAGQARIRGVEVETVWQPLPRWNPGLQLSGNASWLDAVYLDYQNARGFCEQGFAGNPQSCAVAPDGFAYNDGDFSGNRIVRTPEFSAGATLVQGFELPGGLLEFAADYYYNDGYYYLAQNSENTFEDAYALINARVSYLHRRWGLRLTVFGDNLGDERYNLAQFHTDFGRHDSLAPPRTYGVRLNLDL
ncbi:MAG TPA: TonB-dependent receptor [Solimonas sp.]